MGKTFLLIVALLTLVSCRRRQKYEDWEQERIARHQANMEKCEMILRDAEGLGIAFQAHEDLGNLGDQGYKDALFELAQLYVDNCDTIQVNIVTPEQIDSIEDSLLARIEADLADCEEFKAWLESQEDTVGTD